MEMDCQFISIYGKFVTSQTANFLREDVSVKNDNERGRGVKIDFVT